MKLPDKEEAMEAIETIVRYIEQCGSDLREGLENTPERVVQSTRRYSADTQKMPVKFWTLRSMPKATMG